MATVTTLAPIPDSPAPPDVPSLPGYRFSVNQYLAMTKAGILGPDDRVELIDGWIVPKMSKNPPHADATSALLAILMRLAPDGWLVRQESPVVLAENVPEPDLAVFRGRRADFRSRHPRSDEVALIVEVAESSLPLDRGKKWRSYAAGGIPLYWLINLIDRLVEVYSEPMTTDGVATFIRSTIYRPGESIPVVLDGVEVGRVAVSDVLP